MFGFMKKGNAASEATSPEAGKGLDPSKRTSSEPILVTPNFDNENDRQYTAPTKAQKKKYKNDFSDSGGFENQSVQELETYAVHKSEETTSTMNNCLRIAEDIREDASKTLETLHQQGEQIHRTHQMAANIDQDLSKGEKLLNSLGGMFSKPWKPKKAHSITGPLITPDNEPAKRATKEQKDKLMAQVPKGKTGDKTASSGPVTAMQKIEMEKEKQDDALDDLSSILGDLKGMAVDMGGELDKQNKALDHLDKDIDELNSRVKGANQRAKHLLSK
ncbi:putative SNAP25 homologous protein SNAP30 [Silene latifolia]|uniref:putative SNAP25 homologous protein SNAP30 n=1 Tax=Silene latifolia TaxID=37657 RepID=UPI003D7808BE